MACETRAPKLNRLSPPRAEAVAAENALSTLVAAVDPRSIPHWQEV